MLGKGWFLPIGQWKGAHRGDNDDPNEMGDLLEKVYLDSNSGESFLRTATAIAAGNFHTCAIRDNSSIKCWGLNDSGQLGIGNDNNLQYLDRGSDVDLGAGRTARGIAAGDSHTCAMLDNASIKCWGGNAFGQLGLGDDSTRGDQSDEMGDSLPVIGL